MALQSSLHQLAERCREAVSAQARSLITTIAVGGTAASFRIQEVDTQMATAALTETVARTVGAMAEIRALHSIPLAPALVVLLEDIAVGSRAAVADFLVVVVVAAVTRAVAINNNILV